MFSEKFEVRAVLPLTASRDSPLSGGGEVCVTLHLVWGTAAGRDASVFAGHGAFPLPPGAVELFSSESFLSAMTPLKAGHI